MNFFAQLFSSPSASTPKSSSNSNAADVGDPLVVANESSGMNRIFNGSSNIAANNTSTGTSTLSTANLTRFHKNWNYVNATLSSPTMADAAGSESAFGSKSPVPLAQVHLYHTDIPACLSSMADILIDEETRMDPGSTGLCMEYILKHNVIQKLSDLAASDVPRGILGETLKFLTTLIEGMNDQFLVHLNVHRPTIDWLHRCVTQERLQGEYEELWIELMLAICTKISAFPELLTIFLHDYSRGGVGSNKGFSASTDNLVRENKRRALQQKRERQLIQNQTGLEASNGGNAIFGADSDADLASFDDIDGSESRSLPLKIGVTTNFQKSAFSLDNLAEAEDSVRHAVSSPLEDDFVLFAFLLKYIHVADRTGDYARTCFLLLFNNVADNKSFVHYVLRSSDFFMTVVVGLQALFAPLPKMTPLHVGASEWTLKLMGNLETEGEEYDSLGNQKSEDGGTSWQRDLVHFLNLLDFAQNCVVNRDDMTIALRDHMEEAFMKRVWMPCWKQCFSDLMSTDNGEEPGKGDDCLYSFMVFYAYHALKIIHLEPLADLFISYLLSEQQMQNLSPIHSSSPTKKTRSKSLFALLLEKMLPSHMPTSGNSKATIILTSRFVSLLLDLHGHVSLPYLFPGLEEAVSLMRGRPWITNISTHRLCLFRWIELLGQSSLSPATESEEPTSADNSSYMWFLTGYENYQQEAQSIISSHLRNMNWNILGTERVHDKMDGESFETNDDDDNEPQEIGLSMDELSAPKMEQKRAVSRPRKISSARNTIVVAQPWKPKSMTEETEMKAWKQDNESLVQISKTAIFESSFVQNLLDPDHSGGSWGLKNFWDNDLEVNLSYLSLMLSITSCPNPIVYQTLCHADTWSSFNSSSSSSSSSSPFTFYSWTLMQMGHFKQQYGDDEEMKSFLVRIRRQIKSSMIHNDNESLISALLSIASSGSPIGSKSAVSSGSLFFDSWITGSTEEKSSSPKPIKSTSVSSPLGKLTQKMRRSMGKGSKDDNPNPNNPSPNNNVTSSPTKSISEERFERDGLNLILLEEFVKSVVAQLQIHATNPYEQHTF